MLGQRLAQGSDDPDAQVFVDGTRGISLFLRGHFKEARDLLELVSERNGMQKRSGWQSNAYLFAVDTLMVLGDLREAASLRERLLVDAEERGDLYTIVNLHTRATVFLSLAADDPDLARRHLREAMAQWSQTGLPAAALAGDAIRGGDRALRRRRSAGVRAHRARPGGVPAQPPRQRAGAARPHVVPAGPVRDRVARRRAREARRPHRRGAQAGAPAGARDMHWASLTGSILTASAANAAGDRAGAIAALRDVLAGATAAELMLHVAAAQYQLGSLLGGEAGKAMVAQADEEMASRGVRSSSRMAARLVPGRWGGS